MKQPNDISYPLTAIIPIIFQMKSYNVQQLLLPSDGQLQTNVQFS